MDAFQRICAVGSFGEKAAYRQLCEVYGLVVSHEYLPRSIRHVQ